VFINWTQIIQEQVKAGWENRFNKVMSPVELAALLREKEALLTLKNLLKDFPYLWQAAFNGLEQASMSRDDEYALWFFAELKRLDPGFQDFDYTLGEVSSISAEPGMAYFHAKYREDLHTPNKIQPKKKTEK
jgi:hypothetical protein